MSLLEVEGLNAYYGDSHILFDVALRVERNEVVALLGRNGAGKSTTLKTIMGVVQPRTGSVVFDGVDVAGRKSHAIAQAGMRMTAPVSALRPTTWMLVDCIRSATRAGLNPSSLQ